MNKQVVQTNFSFVLDLAIDLGIMLFDLAKLPVFEPFPIDTIVRELLKHGLMCITCLQLWNRDIDLGITSFLVIIESLLGHEGLSLHLICLVLQILRLLLQKCNQLLHLNGFILLVLQDGLVGMVILKILFNRWIYTVYDALQIVQVS